MINENVAPLSAAEIRAIELHANKMRADALAVSLKGLAQAVANAFGAVFARTTHAH